MKQKQLGSTSVSSLKNTLKHIFVEVPEEDLMMLTKSIKSEDFDTEKCLRAIALILQKIKALWFAGLIKVKYSSSISSTPDWINNYLKYRYKRTSTKVKREVEDEKGVRIQDKVIKTRVYSFKELYDLISSGSLNIGLPKKILEKVRNNVFILKLIDFLFLEPSKSSMVKNKGYITNNLKDKDSITYSKRIDKYFDKIIYPISHNKKSQLTKPYRFNILSTASKLLLIGSKGSSVPLYDKYIEFVFKELYSLITFDNDDPEVEKKYRLKYIEFLTKYHKKPFIRKDINEFDPELQNKIDPKVWKKFIENKLSLDFDDEPIDETLYDVLRAYIESGKVKVNVSKFSPNEYSYNPFDPSSRYKIMDVEEVLGKIVEAIKLLNPYVESVYHPSFMQKIESTNSIFYNIEIDLKNDPESLKGKTIYIPFRLVYRSGYYLLKFKNFSAIPGTKERVSVKVDVMGNLNNTWYQLVMDVKRKISGLERQLAYATSISPSNSKYRPLTIEEKFAIRDNLESLYKDLDILLADKGANYIKYKVKIEDPIGSIFFAPSLKLQGINSLEEFFKALGGKREEIKKINLENVKDLSKLSELYKNLKSIGELFNSLSSRDIVDVEFHSKYLGINNYIITKYSNTSDLLIFKNNKSLLSEPTNEEFHIYNVKKGDFDREIDKELLEVKPPEKEIDDIIGKLFQ